VPLSFQAFLNNWLWGQGRNFWIGLSDRETGNGKFVWVDQSEVAFTNWNEGEPSANGVRSQILFISIAALQIHAIYVIIAACRAALTGLCFETFASVK